MAIKPFKWKGLKKLKEREIMLTRALFEFLPATGIREKFNLAIRKTFIKHLGQEVLYFLDAVNEETFGDFCEALPSPSVVIVFGLKPTKRKAFIHIDYELAYLLIDKLLGGGGDVMKDVRPLTETEQGVMQYLIMQLMSEVHRLSGASPRVHFRFEKFAFGAKEISSLASKEDGLSVLTLKLNCFGRSGFIRLIFPDPFIEEVFLNPETTDSKRLPEEAKYFLKQIERYGFIRTSLWADGGSTTLSPVELRDLETGDVLLLDETDVELKGGKVSGEVTVKVGRGEKGGLRGKIKDCGKKLAVEVGGR